MYADGEKPNISKVGKTFREAKKDEHVWASELSCYVTDVPLKNLGIAFSRFFKKKARHPRFKKRGKARSSFYVHNRTLKHDGLKVWIGKSCGWIKTRESLRFKGKIQSATVSETAGRWFISVLVDIGEVTAACENQEVVGVDLGITTLATLSTGQQFESPKPLRKHLKKLKRLQRWVSRKKKGSNNRKKAIDRLAREHWRVACIRDWHLHNLTTELARSFGTVVIQDLNVAGMLKNHYLAMSVSDQGFGEYRKQLEYKRMLNGSKLGIIDRWYPSSKMCSGCGWKDENLTLKDRIFRCEKCGLEIDRDLNAALNKRAEYLRTVDHTGTNACGEVSSGRPVHRMVKLPQRSRNLTAAVSFIKS